MYLIYFDNFNGFYFKKNQIFVDFNNKDFKNLLTNIIKIIFVIQVYVSSLNLLK